MEIFSIMIFLAFFLLLEGVMMLFAFLIGARTSQKADRGEEITLPTLNPMDVYKKHVAQRENDEKQKELETNMYNINNYTGDSTGQKDFN